MLAYFFTFLLLLFIVLFEDSLIILVSRAYYKASTKFNKFWLRLRNLPEPTPEEECH